MLNTKGPISTAKELISKNGGTEGFLKLWELHRLDLSVEALVVSGKYDKLFTQEEMNLCIERLKEYNYEIE